MKTVIIGGGAAGASCAARLRRLDEAMDITIIERTNEVSIANCGLPYYISGAIAEREDILVSSPQKFKGWFNIDVKLNAEAVSINRRDKTITLNNSEIIAYDKLVLATGAKPIVPEFEGLDHNKVFVVRNLTDADKLKAYVRENKPQRAVVVGGGFIGVEVAENLVNMKLDTTLIELSNQILAPVDKEIALYAENAMRENGVKLILSDGVKKFHQNKIVLNSAKEVDFDFVVMAIGVRAETHLAQAAGLAVGKGVIVNEHMQTSDENIFAAGDSVEVKDAVTNHQTLIPLAGPANRQGRIIADYICGIKSSYKGSLGASVIKVFDLTVASVGNNEKQLKQKNIPYLKTYVVGASHAAYYPNSMRIVFKMLFSDDGKILGAQAVGPENVEKRIDVISTIMHFGGTVQDMIDSELCYAPPYSSAKDPVNILGMNADNILRGLFKPAFLEDLDDSCLIDVRPPEMYRKKTIKGAINIPISTIRGRLNEIPKDKKVVLFCNTGYTSYCAARILQQHGFENISSLAGGIAMYNEAEKQLQL